LRTFIPDFDRRFGIQVSPYLLLQQSSLKN
jgi:hypothetical protein